MKELIRLNAVLVGKKFTYAKMEFIALEHTEDETIVITAECVCEKEFDETNSNDWRTSTLKQWLNQSFLKEIIEAGAEEAAILTMKLDLTAHDGLDDYGTDESKIGLLSVDRYKKYRKLLTPIDAVWWLITSYSTKANGYFRYVRYVYSDGSLFNNSAYYGSCGVRPLCTLKSEIFVSVEK